MSHNFFDLTGQTAIVTGASRGLGQYMAIALARAGASLIITARDTRSCDTSLGLIRDQGGTAHALALDVRSETSINDFAKAVRESHGTVDVLVNNAGCNIRKPVTEVSWDDWSTVVDTNLRGTFFVTKAIVPDMLKKQYGRIINIGSVTAVFGYAGIVPYCASRGGVLQMTKAMADEFGSRGVTVNCLAPGWFKTEQSKVLYENPEWLAYLVDRIPVGRPGKPDDLDGAVVFLASRACEYVTGQILLVDGGISTGATRATVTPAER
jgi:NAD(P)-dependent dehydrogenase (short-subunit alcohol dehydrogenase family)